MNPCRRNTSTPVLGSSISISSVMLLPSQLGLLGLSDDLYDQVSKHCPGSITPITSRAQSTNPLDQDETSTVCKGAADFLCELAPSQALDDIELRMGVRIAAPMDTIEQEEALKDHVSEKISEIERRASIREAQTLEAEARITVLEFLAEQELASKANAFADVYNDLHEKIEQVERMADMQCRKWTSGIMFRVVLILVSFLQVM